MKPACLLSLAAFLAASGSARAVNVVFTLTGTSNASVAGATLNVTGLGNVNAGQQSAGSLGPRTLSGTVTVDVDNILAPTTMQFVSATLDPANFGSNVQPAVGGGVGNAPGEFGLVFSVPPVLTEFVAWRNSLTTLSSGAIVMGGGGSYVTTGITFTLTAGTVDYGQAATGTGNLTSIAPANNVGAGPGSYSVVGNTATLTLPNFDYTYITSFNSVPGTIHFTGSLTGTATVVPEPATSGFAAGAAALLLMRRRRK